MRKFTLLLVLLLFMASLVVSCGKKEETPADNMAAGATEEMADTTRLDSAASEMKEMVDSAAQEGADAAKEMVDSAAAKVGGK